MASSGRGQKSVRGVLPDDQYRSKLEKKIEERQTKKDFSLDHEKKDGRKTKSTEATPPPQGPQPLPPKSTKPAPPDSETEDSQSEESSRKAISTEETDSYDSSSSQEPLEETTSQYVKRPKSRSARKRLQPRRPARAKPPRRAPTAVNDDDNSFRGMARRSITSITYYLRGAPETVRRDTREVRTSPIAFYFLLALIVYLLLVDDGS